MLWELFNIISDIGDNVKSAVHDVTTDIEIFADDVGDFVQSTAEDFDTLLDDIADISASFVSTVATGEGEIECASDIQAEANRIISAANDRYESSLRNIEDKLKVLGDLQKNLFKRKKAIAENICKSLGNDLYIPMQVKAIELKAEKQIEQQVPSMWKLPLYMSRTGLVLDGAIRILGSSDRIDRAKQNLSRAKDYEIEISGEIAKLKRVDACILKVKCIMQEEDEILKILERSQIQNYSSERRKIINELEILLAEAILENGHENQKYAEAVFELKKLVS